MPLMHWIGSHLCRRSRWFIRGVLKLVERTLGLEFCALQLRMARA